MNVDEVVALGAAIQAAIEVGEPIGDAVPRFTLGGRRGPRPSPRPPRRAPGDRRHVAQPGDRRRQPRRLGVRQRHRDPPQRADPGQRHARRTSTRPTAGPTRRLEVYVTQGESSAPLDCTILGKYVFDGIQPTDAEVTVDVGLSYDSNGVVQVQADPARHGPRAADDRRAGPRRPLLAGPAARAAARRRASPSRSASSC